jgi:type I restriction enzyme M protein
VVRSLKPGGRAVIIVPDGLLNRTGDHKLRRFIREQCHLDAVISLPVNTFYTTPKKTYILSFVRQAVGAARQTAPVFSYLVTRTGETLDASRFEDTNDLPDMVRQYRHYLVEPAGFSPTGPRCKVWPVERFTPDTHWSVDRWWTEAERVELGLVERKALVTVAEFTSRLAAEQERLDAARRELLALRQEFPESPSTVTISLGDPNYFELAIGERRTRKDYHGKPRGPVPVYSANVFKEFGWDFTSNIDDFSRPFVIWGIDGDFSFALKPAGVQFRTTDHCGRIRILDDRIDPSYLMHKLTALSSSATLDRNLRASLENVSRLQLTFPATAAGEPDPAAQRELSKLYDTFARVKAELAEAAAQIAELELEPIT